MYICTVIMEPTCFDNCFLQTRRELDTGIDIGESFEFSESPPEDPR